MDPQLTKAFDAWALWYGERLNRIHDQLKAGGPHEDYSGYEQDLYEQWHRLRYGDDS